MRVTEKDDRGVVDGDKGRLPASHADAQDASGTVDIPSMSASQWAERRASRHRPKGLAALRAWFMGLPVWQRWSIAVPALVFTLLALLAVVEVATSVGRVHPGVQVAGVGVGGLAPDAAAARLDEELAPRLGEPVTLMFEEQTWSVESTQVLAALNTTSAVEVAMAVGRADSFAVSLRERLRAWFGDIDLAAPVLGDPVAVEVVVSEIATAVDKAPQDATVVIEGTTARVQPSVLGLAVRRDELATTMLSAFASAERTVEVGADFVPVKVTEEDAAQAAEDAMKMMSGPVTVTHEAASWEFPATDIATWIAFRQVPYASGDTTPTPEPAQVDTPTSDATTATAVPGSERMMLEAYIDSAEASKTVTPKVGTAGRSAKDAEFQVSNGAVQIVPSQDGVGPDIEALATEMTTVLTSDETRSVALRTMRVQPEVTTEDAQAMGISGRISTYTTTYDAGNAPRVNNIHTLADALDGTLIEPGGTFSFNGTIGPRTAEKGYQEAPAIVNGQLVPQLGGGICQVGTTIFNSVFESGLPVVERKNHSFYISHYPKGRDATVSWGGPDFKFKNDTEHWILIATGYSNSSLTISLYGTDPGYEVSASTGAWYDVTPHAVREVQDPSMPAGSRVVEDSGVDGRKIVVTRTVTKNGEVVREDRFTSVYKAKEEVVRVGTMPASTTATTSAQ